MYDLIEISTSSYFVHNVITKLRVYIYIEILMMQKYTLQHRKYNTRYNF